MADPLIPVDILQVTGLPHPRGLPLDTSRLASIRMGTTVATNALLERKVTRSVQGVGGRRGVCR